MRRALRTAKDVVKSVGLPAVLPKIEAVERFPVFAPQPFLNRVERGNIDDPLLRQILPSLNEDEEIPGFVTDPLNEKEATLSSGLLQKYEGRVLLVLTGACAIHCRYCFRRNFPYELSPNGLSDWEPIFQQIESDPNIVEVLLSGGDPLTLVDRTLSQIYERLEAIAHLQRIRIHTRLPVVIPSRVTGALLEIFRTSRLQTIFVTHSNHANELDREVAQAMGHLKSVVSQLLNQAVLLQGVNANFEAMSALCRRLIEVDVLPYYLHQLDPVSGAAHFQVPIETGIEIITQLRAKLPGYAVPRYVQEMPGEPNKTVLA